VQLIEKCFAKVHGGYSQLNFGSTIEALIDLTGCPTFSYSLSKKVVNAIPCNFLFYQRRSRERDCVGKDYLGF
jgi:hypothetical protein